MNEVGQIRVREDDSNSAEGMSKVLCGMYVRLNYVILKTYFPNPINFYMKLS